LAVDAIQRGKLLDPLEIAALIFSTLWQTSQHLTGPPSLQPHAAGSRRALRI